MLFFVNIAVQFSSHIFPTLSNEPEAREENTCALVAWRGRVGKGKLVVALECMKAPFGRRTGIEGLVVVMACVGSCELLLSMKWPVAPVSAMILVCGADINLRSNK